MVVEGSQVSGHLGFHEDELLEGRCPTLEEILPGVLAEVRPYEEKYGRPIPVFAAGGVFTGQDMARYTRLGAAGVQLATRFIATYECDASQGFKDVLLQAREEDLAIIHSPVGMPGRAVRTPLIQRLEQGLRFPPKHCSCVWPAASLPRSLLHHPRPDPGGEGQLGGGPVLQRLQCGEAGPDAPCAGADGRIDEGLEGFCMKLAFLYVYQGAQHVGMGRDLYETYPAFREVLDSAPVDFDLKQLCFDGPEERLNDTRYTQPCMVAFAAGVTTLLKDAGIVPDYTAGLSLGEYSALHCAGVLDAPTTISLVAFRGPGHGRRGEGPPLRHGGSAEPGPGYPEAGL